MAMRRMGCAAWVNSEVLWGSMGRSVRGSGILTEKHSERMGVNAHRLE
jgi:hypothetical protein